MDKAPDYGSGDSRFDPWYARSILHRINVLHSIQPSIVDSPGKKRTLGMLILFIAQCIKLSKGRNSAELYICPHLSSDVTVNYRCKYIQK